MDNTLMKIREKLFRIDHSKIKQVLYKYKLKLNFANAYDKKEMVQKVIKLNNKTNISNDMFWKRRWDIKIYDKINLPIIIDNLNPKQFSKRNDGKYLWVIDLPIKMPFSDFAIPTEFEQFSEFLIKAINHEKQINPNFEETYAYLCIDQKYVNPNESQRRPGFHADSFITNMTHGLNFEHNKPVMDTVYLAYDCVPTLFPNCDFNFDNVDYNNNQVVLEHFDKKTTDKEIKVYPNYTILKMDSGCVHAVGINDSNVIKPRTFIKLTFSTQIFNREGNDHNYLIDYKWPLIPRTMDRNTSTSNLVDTDKYMFLDLQYLAGEFILEQNSSLFENKIYNIFRNSSAQIMLATKGELLMTCNGNGDYMTHNIAKYGDWKITNSQTKAQYLLSTENLNKYYDVNQINDDIVPAKKISSMARQLKKPLVINAPWGTKQYLQIGDYLIMRDKNDIYGITSGDFEHNYKCNE